MKHKLISIDDKSIWEKTIATIPHTFAHTHWYNKAMQIASNREIFLYHGTDINFNIICPISPRKRNMHDPYDITTPYGFSGFASIGSCPSFSQEWTTFLAAQGYISGHIMLHPFFQQEEQYRSSDLHIGKSAYYLNLKSELEIIYQHFSTDHKHRLRQWQKMGVTVINSKEEKYINTFIQNYERSLKNRNAAALYNFGDAAWRLLISSPQTILLSVEQHNEIEASALFILHDDIADYFMMSSTDEGRLHARGMIWEAIKIYHQQGVRWLHLGCGIKENDALEQFKSRFGATPYATYALKQIYNKNTYLLLCKQYAVDPDDLSGYFPAYWQQTRSEGNSHEIQ